MTTSGYKLSLIFTLNYYVAITEQFGLIQPLTTFGSHGNLFIIQAGFRISKMLIITLQASCNFDLFN